MSPVVERWIHAGRWAASGGNSQPWNFVVDESDASVRLRLRINHQNREHPSRMDVDGLGSVAALGCFAFNFGAAAAIDGFECVETKFQNGERAFDFEAVLLFQKIQSVVAPFSIEEILVRRTDRGRLGLEAISDRTLEKIRGRVQGVNGARLIEFSDRSKVPRSRLHEGLLALERRRWQVREIRESLLSELSFNPETASQKIPVEHLCLGFADVSLLGLINRAPRLGRILELGLDFIPAKKALDPFLHDGDQLWFLELKRQDSSVSDGELYFQLGFCFESLWIEANSNGVSLQPLGLPFLVRSVESWSTTLVTEFERVSTIRLDGPVIGFRLGITRKLAERTSRRERD